MPTALHNRYTEARLLCIRIGAKVIYSFIGMDFLPARVSPTRSAFANLVTKLDS